jgi:radical SAM superfamily enzyme YgiQ (UPF0313 family)
LGLSSIYSALRNIGVNVKIFDTTPYLANSNNESQAPRVCSLQVKPADYSAVGFRGISCEPKDDFVNIVNSFKPNLIGLSCVELTYNYGLKLLASVKYLNIATIVGGCFATFAADYIMQNDLIDMVCIGEGENIIVDLVRKMANNDLISDIAGLWVKSKNERRIIESPPNHLLDVNSLPMPNYEGFDPVRIYRSMAGKIYRMIPIEISRGCPYKCTYCSAPMYRKKFEPIGKWLRYKTVDRIMAEIEYLVKEYNAEYIYFISETFLALSNSEKQDFYKRYIKYKIPFWFNTRPETVNEYDIQHLQEIGCHRISLGIESGNEEFRRKILGRNYSNKTVVEAVKIIKNTTIQLSVNNMIGFPDETRDLIFDTIELNRQFRADSHSVSIFQPFKGTELFNVCVNKGYWNPAKICDDSFETASLDMPSLTKEEVQGLYRTFNLYINLDKKYWSQIKEAEISDSHGDRMFAEFCKLING